MSDNIANAPHGMNLVVELEGGGAIIGRFDESNGFEVLMHDVDVWEAGQEGDREHWVRETATYGVDVKQRDCTFPASNVKSWVPLGQVEKLS